MLTTVMTMLLGLTAMVAGGAARLRTVQVSANFGMVGWATRD